MDYDAEQVVLPPFSVNQLTWLKSIMIDYAAEHEDRDYMRANDARGVIRKIDIALGIGDD